MAEHTLRPTFATPKTRAAERALRRKIEAAVDRLLDALDRLDGDTDAEPDADGEPSLAQVGQRFLGGEDDREADDDGRDTEAEPTLGAPENHERRASAWGRGSRQDGEAEPWL